MSDTVTTIQEPQRPTKTTSFGKRLGQGLYWVLIIWITFLGASSIIGKVFFDRPSADPSITAERCQPETDRMEARLVAFGQVNVANSPQRRPFFIEWDREFRRLKASCDHTNDAQLSRLERLRYQIESLMERAEETRPLVSGHAAPNAPPL